MPPEDNPADDVPPENEEFSKLVDTFVKGVRAKGFKVAFLPRTAVMYLKDFNPDGDNWTSIAAWVPDPNVNVVDGGENPA